MEIEVGEEMMMRSMEEGGGGGGGYLVWEEVTVVLPNNNNNNNNKPTKRILNGLTGFAQPSRIMAIMGPSGSGKSTLLDSLAGRLAGNVVMTGNVLLNGKKKRLDYGAVNGQNYAANTPPPPQPWSVAPPPSWQQQPPPGWGPPTVPTNRQAAPNWNPSSSAQGNWQPSSPANAAPPVAWQPPAAPSPPYQPAAPQWQPPQPAPEPIGPPPSFNEYPSAHFVQQSYSPAGPSTTHEQPKNLSQLFEAMLVQDPLKPIWIMDTGATDHVHSDPAPGKP